MYKIGIRFNTRDFQRMLGSLRMIRSRVFILKDQVPRISAIEFSQLLVSNIMSQKYMGGYAPYNPKYAQWKSERGLGGGFWRLMNDLVRAISHSKVSQSLRISSYFAGVPAGILDSGGKSWFTSSNRKSYGKRKPIAWYGRIMEEGGTFPTKTGVQVHPPRPLFQPTTEEYEKGPWMNHGDRALSEIRNRWRR